MYKDNTKIIYLALIFGSFIFLVLAIKLRALSIYSTTEQW